MQLEFTNSRVTTSPYSTIAFNTLPEFQESKARFDAKHYVLDELGTIIRQHGLQRYVGVALIHKHFDLQDGERVVERVDANGSILQPVLETDESVLTPYLWHLSRLDDVRFQWTPMEFVLSDNVPAQVNDLAREFPSRKSFITELAEVLIRAEAQDTFGISFLHRQRIGFDHEEQILLESPGPTRRTLIVSPVARERTTDHDYTQTYWHFDIDSSSFAAGCDQHGCAGYCSLHSPTLPKRGKLR